MKEEITQEYVDNAFAETKREWDKLVMASGKHETIFALSSTGTQFLGSFQEIREQVIALGLTIPNLCAGVTVAFNKD